MIALSMESSQQKWQQCLDLIKVRLHSPEQFDIWFKPLSCLRYADNTLTIDAPSSYFAEQLEERYIEIISEAVKKSFGPTTRLFYHFNQIGNDPSTGVTIAQSNDSRAVKAPTSVSSILGQKVESNIDSNLNPSYTFENYCGSASNRLALSIGEAIAANPKVKTFNPLFVFGPTGVGKTHLIQAIGIRLKETDPALRVLYVTARLFESEYTSAVSRSKINDFIAFYQSIDVLIIDDIQDLAGKKPGTQNAFFHIFNHLHQNQRQLILSSDCRPSEMEGLEERMLSRFKWGMTAELEKPDYELRKEVLRLKAEQSGLDLSDEVMDFIATNVTDSVRVLEGIVISLVANAMVLNREITLSLARSVMSNAVKSNRKPVNFELISRRVCDFYDIDIDMIFNKNRKREISDARQIIMYLAHKHAKMPSTAIANRLSRNHATILHGCRNVEERLAVDKKLRDDISKIEEEILP